MIYSPYKYQDHAYNHIIDNPYGGLFLDMGLGKTVITLTAIEWLMYQDLDVKKTLVIGPKNVILSVWAQEALKWDHTKHLKFSVIWGDENTRLRALRANADVYLINRENLTWLQDIYKTAWPFDFVVADELSSFKSHKSQRFKALNRVRPYINRFMGLTGTPAPNGLMDVWAPVYLMDQGARLEKTITGFRTRYFVPVMQGEGMSRKYILRPEAANAIHTKISDICISMKSEDYLDLPPLIQNDIVLDMSPSTYEKYKKFERDSIMELGDQEITALNAGALTNKLLQFSNGAVYHSDKSGMYTEIHDEKLDALEDILEESFGQPVLIFYTFKHDAERIKRRFPKMRQLKDHNDIAEWNMGKIPYMMAHPASAGHGLNLQQGGNIIVWFGLNWSLELYLQAIKRLHRQGQVNTVIMHRLLMRKTMDMRVATVLREKENGQDALMEAVKAYVDEVKLRYRVA